MQTEFDLIVIGAGPGGYVSAIRGAQEGMRVAIVENREIGGTCLNRGCIPTKTLMHAAQLYREMGDCGKFGVFAENVSYDITRIYARKEEVVSQMREGVVFLLKSNKITLFTGAAQITAPGAVSVACAGGKTDLFARNILIATGSVPARPPIPGLELPGVITSDEILAQPGTGYRSLVIIGGGVIGVEFATIVHSLGCAVTIIEAMDRILPNLDRELSQSLSMLLKRRGVVIHTAASLEGIARTDEGLTCSFRQKGVTASVEAQSVLVAIGRRANVEGLFAGELNAEFDRGLVVNEHFETSIRGIYAVGDVIHGGIQLAHAASAQGCSAVAHMVGKPPELDLTVVPSCVYTDPEIASVGLTEAQAKERGLTVKTGKFTMAGNGKSIINGQERGFIKVVSDAESEVILGAQLMCARATDLVSELATAIVNRLTIRQLASVIRPHPTFTEGVTEAVEHTFGKALHIAPRK